MNPIRRSGVLAAVALAALVAASTAWAHAEISPAFSLSSRLQLYSLAVPTEKEGLTTTKVVLTVPGGFGIDSFVAAPGWTRSVQAAGSGEDAVVQRVTWTGGSTPTGEDSLFRFLARPAKSGTYAFEVEQTYSDGSVVDWNGAESSDDPAPTIRAVSSLAGGGSSTLALVALAVGGLALAVGLAALLRGGGRELA